VNSNSNWFTRHKYLLPLFWLTLFIVITVIKGFSRNFYYITENHLAFSAITFLFICYFLMNKIYPYLLAAVIIAGLFNLLVFTISVYTYRLRLGGLNLVFQPHAMIALNIYIAVYWKQIQSFVSKLLGNILTEEDKLAYQKHVYKENYLKFKERYANYTDERLTTIVEENKFVPEAVEAAKKILDERMAINRIQ
jgi:hypothetical protein